MLRLNATNGYHPGDMVSHQVSRHSKLTWNPPNTALENYFLPALVNFQGARLAERIFTVGSYLTLHFNAGEVLLVSLSGNWGLAKQRSSDHRYVILDTPLQFTTFLECMQIVHEYIPTRSEK